MSGERPLRIVHIGSGFRPWRRGGLVAYVEDIIDEQVRRGHQVAYLFAGRIYPFGRPRLHRWERGPVPMLEIVNSPLRDHGRQPDVEVDELRVETIVARELERLQPDVVHVQELAGLPSSVLDVAARTGAPVLFTLQDYFALCPAFKLLDADGAACLRTDVGHQCVATVAVADRDPDLLVDATIRHHLWWAPGIRRLSLERRRSAVDHLAPPLVAAGRRRRAAPAAADAYQRRRDVNVERLNRVGRLIAMSSRVAEIYALLGVAPERLCTMQLTLSHIEHLRPRVRTPGAPVTFATLGGSESPAKGARLLLDAARSLEHAVGFRLLVFGHPEPTFVRQAAELPCIELRGPYAPQHLDALLEEVDVGIVPSLWEEAYGYAGMEFLAKGIPVVGNAVGGIPDYLRDGETGWLNRSCSAAGLTGILRDIIDRPEQVDDLNTRLRVARPEIVMTMEQHADELDGLYREELARSSSRVA